MKTNIKHILEKLEEIERISNYEYNKRASERDLEDVINWINYTIKTIIIPEVEQLQKRNKKRNRK
jgi:hypothetical protein